MTILAHLDSQIMEMLQGGHSTWFLEGQIAMNAKNLESIEEVREAAAFYGDSQEKIGLAKMKQLHGKELSFNNILDLNAAVEFIKDFEKPAAVIIKHNNPTGVAQDTTLAKAYKQAWAADPVSAFGGIIGFNRAVDVTTAKLVSKSGFMECIIALGFDKEALALLTEIGRAHV